ncbi:MAG TPA: DUF2779 domain-containing protein [Gemmatimonadaceae bacterium]|nr:DUF2779 domain-containing protein [Gemmatimonadaceae bacterium]
MPEAVPFRTLSKSDYKLARTCPTKLYYKELRYPTSDDQDPYLAMLARGGYMVEQVAKLRYPLGIALEYGGDPRADAETTAECLTRENVTLFEATLLSGQKLARVDILEKRGKSFRLVEIKAKSWDSRLNAERLAEGKPNLIRTKRRNAPIASEWEEYIADIAFQVLVLRELYPNATIRPFLCLVDKAKRTTIDGLPAMFRVERRVRSDGTETLHRVHFTGDAERVRQDDVLTEVDVSEEVAVIMDQVREEVDTLEASLRGGLRRLTPTIGHVCRKCEYRLDGLDTPDDPHGFAECWGGYAQVTPLVLDLYHATESIVAGALHAGRVSLLDVPEESLTKSDGSIGRVARRQLIQIRHTRSATPWCDPGLRGVLEGAEYPLHFIDFEAARLALPPHAGMRPYGLVAFQWSCHTIERPGAPLTHAEWLNTVDLWPNAEFARTLRERIGRSGTVLAWAGFERSTLKDVLKELEPFGEDDPELRAWLEWLTEKDRILDLNQVTLNHFFHPAMGGRTSIKFVLDALWRSDSAVRERFREVMGYDGDPARDPYAALPPLEINGKPQAVVEGTGAIRAYEAMMYGVEREDQATRAAWEQLLSQYCRLDTLAMVLIWEHWSRLAARPPTA